MESETNPPDFFTELTVLKNGGTPTDMDLAAWAAEGFNRTIYLQVLLDEHADPFLPTPSMRKTARELHQVCRWLDTTQNMSQYQNFLRHIIFTAREALRSLTSPLEDHHDDDSDAASSSSVSSSRSGADSASSNLDDEED